MMTVTKLETILQFKFFKLLLLPRGQAGGIQSMGSHQPRSGQECKVRGTNGPLPTTHPSTFGTLAWTITSALILISTTPVKLHDCILHGGDAIDLMLLI